MREILFRGKKTDKNRHYYFNNGWVYGDLIHPAMLDDDYKRPASIVPAYIQQREYIEKRD